jgi:peptidoglycan/LPS O-acetylase OafA/YrhL
MLQLSRRKFEDLDALRGIAAIAVMLYHFTPFLSSSTVFPTAYLAVDLFFLLSGFVLCHAYDQRLQAGMRFREFVGARLVRLYPLYIAGTLLGLVYVLGRARLQHDGQVPGADLATSLGLSVLFLPNLSERNALGGLYPFDLAAWSLFFELAINLAYGVTCGWLTQRRLIAVVAFGAVALVAAILAFHTIDVGMTRRTLMGGTARVLFSFSAGVLLYRVRGRIGAGLPAVPPALLWVVLAGSLVAAPPWPWRALYELGCAMLLFPTLILLAAQTERERPFWLASLLGRLSYPVYILHTPLVLLLAGAWKAIERQDPIGAAPTPGILFAIFVLAASYVAARVYDEPMRTRLGFLLRPHAAWVAPRAAVPVSVVEERT